MQAGFCDGATNIQLVDLLQSKNSILIERQFWPTGGPVHGAISHYATKQNNIKGKPEVSDTFNSKSMVIAWAKKMEDSIREGRLLPRKEDLERAFGDLIDRYDPVPFDEHIAGPTRGSGAINDRAAAEELAQ